MVAGIHSHRNNEAPNVAERVKARSNKQGGLDAEIVRSLVLMQLAGGECLDDVRILQSDDGVCRVRQSVELELLEQDGVYVKSGAVTRHAERRIGTVGTAPG